MNIEEQKKLLAMKRTTRSQLRASDQSWEGRLWENHQAMNKKSIRGRQGGMSWHNIAKSLHLTALEVNGTLGWWSIKCLPGEISPTCGSGNGGASAVETRWMIGEKSAEAIVVGIKQVGGQVIARLNYETRGSLNPTKG